MRKYYRFIHVYDSICGEDRELHIFTENNTQLILDSGSVRLTGAGDGERVYTQDIVEDPAIRMPKELEEMHNHIEACLATVNGYWGELPSDLYRSLINMQAFIEGALEKHSEKVLMWVERMNHSLVGVSIN